MAHKLQGAIVIPSMGFTTADPLASALRKGTKDTVAKSANSIRILNMEICLF